MKRRLLASSFFALTGHLLTIMSSNKSDVVIKRTYDEYKNKDFSYGDLSSTNLNPKREISFDTLDKIAEKLQEVTDDIIRRKIEKPKEQEKVIRSAFRESIPLGDSPQKQQKARMTGNMNSASIFPSMNSASMFPSLEKILGTFPGSLDELDKPPQIDCEPILKRFDLDVGDSKETTNSNEDPASPCTNINAPDHVWEQLKDMIPSKLWNEKASKRHAELHPDWPKKFFNLGTCPICAMIEEDALQSQGSLSFDRGSLQNQNQDKLVALQSQGSLSFDSLENTGILSGFLDEGLVGAGDSEVSHCAEIELNWLKIILVITKVVKSLKKIIDLVISIVVPVIDTLHLAVGAWISPPNIPLIYQKVVQQTTASIVFIIGSLLQLLWNFLNLDCYSDQTESLIRQIKQALSAFTGLASEFNPNAVVLLTNKINEEVLNPLNDVMKEANSKKEEWADLAKQIRDGFGDLFNVDDLKAQIERDIVNGIASTPQVGKAASIVGQAKDLYDTSIPKALQAIKEIEDLKNVKIKMQKKNSQAELMLSGLEFTVTQAPDPTSEINMKG